MNANAPRETSEPSPVRTRARFRAGLRLQIVLALAGLMLLSFGPLFFAVASLARIRVFDLREQEARAIAHGLVEDMRQHRRAKTMNADSPLARALEPVFAGYIAREISAICLFESHAADPICAGAPFDLSTMRSLGGVSTRVLRGPRGPVLEVATPDGDASLVIEMRVDPDDSGGADVVRPVALYMTIFGLALLVFAYFALTRLIVRPVDQLVQAADRVASGARTLRIPRKGPYELALLAASVQAMGEKLIAEESALLRKVSELTETTTQLTETRAELVRSERMASVGQLAAGLAHEIGNPIAALMGMLDLLLEGDQPADVERDFLRRMRGETERIHAVVRDLLDFARPEEMAGTVATAAPPRSIQPPADVSAAIDDVVGLVRPQKSFQRIKLDVRVEGALRVALGAPRLTQVILNLVLNAAAAIASQPEEARLLPWQRSRPSGREGGRIAVYAEATSRERVRIVVEDDGPGVDPAVKDRLFEPFITTKGVGQGTGLGLAVCRGLVASAGGEIGLDDSFTGGARFYVLLPSAPA